MGNITFFAKRTSSSFSLPTGSYAHYIADSWVSSSNWPDENDNADLVNSAGTINKVSNGINGYDYIRFDSDNSRMTSNAISAIPDDLTIGVVCRWSRAGYGTPDGYHWGIGVRDPYKQVVLRFNLGANQVSVEGFGGALTSVASATWFSTETWYVVTVRYKAVANWIGGDHSGELRQNGSLIGSGNYTVYDATGTNTIMLGYDYGSFSDYDLAEFIYYKEAFSDSQMTQLEGYLMNKYNIS